MKMKQPKRLALTQIYPVQQFNDLEPRSATMPSKQSITIIEMGGFHSTMIPVTKGEEKIGGAAYVADAVTRIRQKYEPILISNGDVFTGQTTSLESGGNLVIQFMNQLEFDAMTLGIHDFDEGQVVLATRILEAKFPVIAGNLICAKTGKHVSETDHMLSRVKPYVLLDRGMNTAIVLGMMKEEAPMFQRPENLEGLTFWPARDAIMHWLPSILEERPRVIIIQYNKTSEAEQLAVQMNEYIYKWKKLNGSLQIPMLVFIGGHTDEKPIYGPNYFIMQGTDRGYRLGVIKITQQYNRNKVLPEYTKISDKWFLPDPKISQLVQEIKRRIDLQDAFLGHSKTMLNRERLIDSPLGILITEAMKQHAKAEISFISSGTTKLDIRPGDIYSSDVDQAIPFKDSIITMELTGSKIREILEQSAKLEADAGGSGGKILQVSGLRFKYDLRLEKGKRILDLMVNGKNIDNNRIYLAAVSNYLVDGGDGYIQFKDGKFIKDMGDVKTIVKAYIKTLGMLEIKRDKRIEVLGE